MAESNEIMITVDVDANKAVQSLQNLKNHITTTAADVNTKLSGSVTNMGTRLTSAGNKIHNFGANIKQKIGTEAALAFAAAGTAALAFAKQCVNSAIQSESAWTRYGALVNQGGGNWETQKGEIKSWASTFSNSMGYAVSDTREAMTALAEFGVKQSEMKTAMQGVAGVAARTGMSEAEASNMVISALNGRAMQLKKYTGLEIENYKAADGTIDRERLLNDLYNQNKDAIEAHGNTTEAQIQRMQNSWGTLKTSIGNALLPVVKAVADAVSWVAAKFNALNKSHPIIAQIAAAFLAVGGAIGVGIGALGMIAGPLMNLGTMISTVGKAMEGFSLATKMSTLATKAHTIATTVWNGITKAAAMAQAALNAVMEMNPIYLVVIAIVALIAVLIYLYKNNEQVRNAINALGDYLKGAFIAAWDAVRGAIDWVVSSLQNAWNVLTGFFGGLRGTVSDSVSGIGDTINNALGTVGQIIWNAITGYLDFCAQFRAQVIQIILGIFTNLVSTITTAFTQAQQVASTMVGLLVTVVVSRFTALVNNVRMFFTNIVNTIRGRLGNAAMIATLMAARIRQVIVTRFQQLVARVRQFFTNIVSTIRSRLSNAVSTARQQAVQIYNNIVNTIRGIPGQISNEFGKLKDIIKQKLIDAAKATFEGAQNVVNMFLGGLDRHSPGKVQRETLAEFSSLPGIVLSQGALAARSAASAARGIVSSWNDNMETLGVSVGSLPQFDAFNPVGAVSSALSSQSLGVDVGLVGSDMSSQSLSSAMSSITNSNVSNTKNVEYHEHIEHMTIDLNSLPGTEKERWYNMLSEISRGV